MECPVKWCDQYPHFRIDIKDIALTDANYVNYKVVLINRGEFRALIHEDLSGLVQTGSHDIWYTETFIGANNHIKILLIRRS